MGYQKIDISESIDQLTVNLSEIARVDEWAKHMGYETPQLFGYKFLRYFKIRPCKILIGVRLKSISIYLRSEEKISNFEIALAHSLPDEKALNNFTKYHIDCPPTVIKSLTDKELGQKFIKFGIKILE
jgi:AraC-like DNA-binding protein